MGQIWSYGAPSLAFLVWESIFIGLYGKGCLTAFACVFPSPYRRTQKDAKGSLPATQRRCNLKIICMTTATVHKRLRPQAQETDLRNFQAAARRILSNKKSMLRLLQATGLHDARGQLKPEFR